MPGVDLGGKTGRERQGVCCLAAFYRGRASPAELRSGPSQWHTGGRRWRSVQTKKEESDSDESESGRGELGEGAGGGEGRGSCSLLEGACHRWSCCRTPPPRCIYTAQVNEASPDLFRPAINTPLRVVLFTVTESW